MTARDMGSKPLGEIFDRSIQMFTSHLALFAGIAVFPALANLGQSLAAHHPKFPGEPTAATMLLAGGSYLASFIFWVASLILQPLGTAALCLTASRLYLDEPTTIRCAYGSLASKIGRWIGLEILQGLFAGWPLILVVILSVVFLPNTSGEPLYWIVAVCIWTPGIVALLVLYTRYALAFPASAIEGRTASDAIARSVSLGEGFRWKVFGGFALPMIVVLLGVFSGAMLTEWLAMPQSPIANAPVVRTLVGGLLTLVIEVLFTPIAAILITLIYYDLRVAKEGFDLLRMLDGVEAPPAPTPAVQETLDQVTAAAEQIAMEKREPYQADAGAAWGVFGATAPALEGEPRDLQDGEVGTEAKP